MRFWKKKPAAGRGWWRKATVIDEGDVNDHMAVGEEGEVDGGGVGIM